MQVIAIAAQKGGTGKTTLTLAAGSYLAAHGRKCLYVDLDGQGSLTATVRPKPGRYTVLDVLQGKCNAAQAIHASTTCDIIPSTDLLEQYGVLDNVQPDALKKALATLDYDFIIIDTPPALSKQTINALMAASGVIIPVNADRYGLDALTRLDNTIKAVQGKNSRLAVIGIAVNRYTATSAEKLCLERMERQAATMGTKILQPVIRQRAAIRAAQLLYKSDIYAYDKQAAADLEQLFTNVFN